MDFDSELPVYEYWTAELKHHFYDQDQSCASRRAPCESKTQFIQCKPTRRHWFSRSSSKPVCRPVTQQWEQVADEILTFSKHVDVKTVPVVPLASFIRDLIVEYEPRKLNGKSQSILDHFIQQEKQQVRADIQACQFYFLLLLLDNRSFNILLYHELKKDPNVLSEIFQAKISLRVRLLAILGLFEEVFLENRKPQEPSILLHTPIFALTSLLSLIAVTTVSVLTADFGNVARRRTTRW